MVVRHRMRFPPADALVTNFTASQFTCCVEENCACAVSLGRVVGAAHRLAATSGASLPQAEDPSSADNLRTCENRTQTLESGRCTNGIVQSACCVQEHCTCVRLRQLDEVDEEAVEEERRMSVTDDCTERCSCVERVPQVCDAVCGRCSRISVDATLVYNSVPVILQPVGSRLCGGSNFESCVARLEERYSEGYEFPVFFMKSNPDAVFYTREPLEVNRDLPGGLITGIVFTTLASLGACAAFLAD